MTFEEIKARYNILDVATRLGLQLKAQGNGEYRGVSIAPGEHKTDDALSISTTNNEWHDFSSEMGGSVLDLVALYQFGNNDGEALRKAAEWITGETCDTHYSTGYVEERDTFRENVDKWHEALLADQKALDYLHGRRINDETIKRFKLGRARLYNGAEGKEWRLVCPYFDRYGQPIYYASRQLDWEKSEGSEKYLKAGTKNSAFFRNSLFGLDTIPHKDKDCDTLILPEGLFDTLSFAQEGYSVLSPISGHAGKENVPVALREAKRFRQVVTAFDIDGNLSGQRFTISWGHKFLAEHINFSCINSYGEGKDVSDYYTEGGDLAELIKNAVNGYVFMSRYSFWETSPVKLSESVPFARLSTNDRAKALTEVKKFVRILHTFLDTKTFAEVKETLREYFPADRIEKFSEPPSHEEIVQDMCAQFMKDRLLFHTGDIKHGEYMQYDADRGHWCRITDGDIQGDISAFFKHLLDSKTVAQITTRIRQVYQRADMPAWNKTRVAVFPNGTLELDTGILREHSPDDFMTWAHTFNYEPEATCPTYDAFLDSVAAGEQSRVDFLDDLAAYILYEDCRLEKIFFLIGEGMNGKGVYLKTLEALFKSSNTRTNSQSVTNVQPDEFDKPTARIGLEHSMLNIAHDINSNLKGCGSYLKSIASGDTIDGNLKFHDTRSFSTRSKIVCSSNHMVKIDDASYGMSRRLMFCKFTVRFEGQADIGLLNKHIAELPGIFNRVYRAYRALLEREKTQGNKAIREAVDQNAMLTTFTEIANPVAAFWNEHGEGYLAQREVRKDELFNRYREFCERNSLLAGCERQFHEDLQKVIGVKGKDWKFTRHRDGKQQPCYYVFTNGQAPAVPEIPAGFPPAEMFEEPEQPDTPAELLPLIDKLDKAIPFAKIGHMAECTGGEACYWYSYTAEDVRNYLELDNFYVEQIDEALQVVCRKHNHKFIYPNDEGDTMYLLPKIIEK